MTETKGINYEVGLKFHPEHRVDYEAISREIEHDLEDIKEMGCNSVRIYGDNPGNLYEDASNRASYAKELEKYKRHGKPVAITEFGTAPYKGAGHLGGYAHSVIDWQRGRLRRGLGFMPVFRDEKAQADYLERLMKMYEEHEIDAHFIFEYISWNTPHTPDDPKRDLSTGSFGLVHKTPEGEKVRSEAYHRVKQIIHETNN